ncbi:MAG: biotin transporter BioY [Firmicutes bacterium]|nr:biotin transporter BioY [Bacillota bacterium]
MSEIKNGKKIHDLVYIALGAVLITVCSWISIPTEVPFTLQTMGVFLVCYILGGKRASISVLVYLLLGTVGVPVFSGFMGGPARLIGPTGGYLIGFLGSALVYLLTEKLMGEKLLSALLGMILGLFVCYLFGSIWFYILYNRGTGSMGFSIVLMKCVIPFIPVDIIKIGLALFLGKLLKKVLKDQL